MTKILTVLDADTNILIIRNILDTTDPEDYIEHILGLDVDGCAYLCSNNIKLDINVHQQVG